MTPHLINEQLDALLADPAPTHPHLETCARCREELTTLQASFADLRTALTNATGVPHDQASEASFIVGALPARRRRAPAWALATAAFLLATAIIPALHHPHPAPAAPIVSNQDDEALLQSIQNDLSTPMAPSLKPLALDTPPPTRPRLDQGSSNTPSRLTQN